MNSELLASIALVLFVLGFAYLGVQFLRKKKRERIEIMTRVLDEPIAEEAKPERITELPTDLPPKPLVMPAPKRDLSQALTSTRRGWVSRLSQALSGKSDQHGAVIEKIEEILFSADIGVKTSGKLLDIVKANLSSSSQEDMSKVKDKVAGAILQILQSVQTPPVEKRNGSPCVVMFVGVNGVGKTTTIGKLASQFAANGSKVILGAGDTFRAAAAEQLDIWAHRTGSEIVRGLEQADPASVLFDAVALAKQKGADYVLCDTAGRLHTKVNLMEELKKVHRVLGKASEGAPQEVLLVVDATTGQNAIEQARQFKAATPLTGVILTKLDGTAKGGVVIGIADELGIPIRYIGVGESASDLRPFDADEFVKALFAEETHS